MKFARSFVIPLGVLGALAAGCATTPIPADKLARSTASVRAAEVVNADNVPTAAVHLRLARKQIALAKRLLMDGDNKEAGDVLVRAEADADAAMNLAREDSAKREAAQAQESVRALRAQLEGSKS